MISIKATAEKIFRSVKKLNTLESTIEILGSFDTR